jgi:hypothetical protein
MSELFCQASWDWVGDRLYPGGVGGREEGEERGVAAAEGFKIALLGIRDLRLPAAEQDANPFEGQGAECGVVPLASGTLLEVEGFGLGGALTRAVGELVERLQQELRAGPAAVNVALFAAPLRDRRDSREGL